MNYTQKLYKNINFYVHTLFCKTTLSCDEKNSGYLILLTAVAQTAMSVYSQRFAKPNTFWSSEGRLGKIFCTLYSRKLIINHRLQVVR